MVTGFYLRFYDDDGCVPGTLVQEFIVTDEEADETLIYMNGGYPVYRYEAPVSIQTTAHQRYWFSVIGVHEPVQPQWGRQDAVGITDCETMFRSQYFSFPDWVSASVIIPGGYEASQEILCQPFVEVDHLLLDSTTDESAPLPVEATITGHGHALDPDGIWIEYRIEPSGTWIREAMSYEGGGNWSATIPVQQQPAELSYYIHAEDVIGHVTEVPWGGMTDPHRFDVAWTFDPFEDESGWIVDPDGSDTAVDGIWECVDPEASLAQPEDDHTIRGTDCWITDGSPGGYGGYNGDVDGGTTTLQSPVLDLTGARGGVLKYWRWFSNDHEQWDQDDSWVVQARNNGGDWVDLENTMQPLLEWTLVRRDLGGVFAEDLGAVEVRFRASDSGEPSMVEAAVDDFTVLADFRDPQGIGDPRDIDGGFVLQGPTPNPFRHETSIRFGLTQTRPVRLSIHDISGRRIRSLLDASVEKGNNGCIWDGTDDSGRPVRSGVYYVRLISERREISKPVTFVR